MLGETFNGIAALVRAAQRSESLTRGTVSQACAATSYSSGTSRAHVCMTDSYRDSASARKKASVLSFTYPFTLALQWVNNSLRGMLYAHFEYEQD